MQKSTLILLVLSALLVLGTEAQRRRSMNNFMANRFLFDLNLQCPYSLFRRGGRIPRAMINQAFTLADCTFLERGDGGWGVNGGGGDRGLDENREDRVRKRRKREEETRLRLKERYRGVCVLSLIHI